MKTIVLLLPLFLIVGCSHVFSRSPTNADISGAEPDRYISEAWLAKHRTEVEDRIVAYVKERYPTVPADWPGLEVGRISVANKVHETNRPSLEKAEAEMKRLFERIAHRVMGTRPQSVTLDIDVTFMHPGTSKAEETAYVVGFVPMMALCWGSLLMVCPAAGTDYVVLDASFADARGGTVKIRGIGGATGVVSNVVLGDSPDPEHVREAATKAMAAAVADLGAKLVPHLEARK